MICIIEDKSYGEEKENVIFIIMFIGLRDVFIMVR